jgi:methylsterol monooxygenase
VLPATRLNDGLLPLLPIVFFVGVTILFNKTQTAVDFYTWLNANYTPWEINTYWTLAITSSSYWLVGFVFMAFDMNDSLHNLVKKYKLQPDVRLSWAQYREVMRIALRNLVFVNVPLTFATAYMYPLRTTLPLPGGWTVFGHYWLCMLFEEVGFYAVHRLVHHKALYARVHKLHHAFTAPVALASTYCTMPEHLFVSSKCTTCTALHCTDIHL